MVTSSVFMQGWTGAINEVIHQCSFMAELVLEINSSMFVQDWISAIDYGKFISVCARLN